MWKILIPCICNTAPKEEILELATLFHGHFKDYKILIARLRPAKNKSKAQISKRLRAEKMVCQLFEGCSFENAFNEWDCAKNSRAECKINLEKFNENVNLYLRKTLLCSTVKCIKNHLA